MPRHPCVGAVISSGDILVQQSTTTRSTPVLEMKRSVSNVSPKSITGMRFKVRDLRTFRWRRNGSEESGQIINQIAVRNRSAQRTLDLRLQLYANLNSAFAGLKDLQLPSSGSHATPTISIFCAQSNVSKVSGFMPQNKTRDGLEENVGIRPILIIDQGRRAE